MPKSGIFWKFLTADFWRRMSLHLRQNLDQFLHRPHNPVKKLVHQLWLDHLGDIYNRAFAAAGEPAGFGVGAAAAGEDEDAGVGPIQGLEVGGELAFGEGVVEAFGVLGEGPGGGVRVDVGPVEAGAAVGRVTEVIDFVARSPEAGDDVGVIGVPPAGCDVDFGHDDKDSFTKISIFVGIDGNCYLAT